MAAARAAGPRRLHWTLGSSTWPRTRAALPGAASAACGPAAGGCPRRGSGRARAGGGQQQQRRPLLPMAPAGVRRASPGAARDLWTDTGRGEGARQPPPGDSPARAGALRSPGKPLLSRNPRAPRGRGDVTDGGDVTAEVSPVGFSRIQDPPGPPAGGARRPGSASDRAREVAVRIPAVPRFREGFRGPRAGPGR